MGSKSLIPLIAVALVASYNSVTFAKEEAQDKQAAKSADHSDHKHADKKADTKKDSDGHDHGKKDDHEHHHHTAPHDGTLVVFGEESAHFELVLDPATGKLTAFSLDGEAEKAVPLAAPAIELAVKVSAKKSDSGTTGTTISLKAVANPLTGETIGATSQYEGQSDLLKGAKKFHGTFKSVTIKGAEFKNVEFKFPEGNE
jgi:hypothetical protein